MNEAPSNLGLVSALGTIIRLELQLALEPVVIDIGICPFRHDTSVELTAEPHSGRKMLEGLNKRIERV
jgi:hypothetical protein